jgi:hypothetical protein
MSTKVEPLTSGHGSGASDEVRTSTASPGSTASQADEIRPLDETEELERDDIVKLLHDALRLREIYIDPRRGLGGELLDEASVRQLRDQDAPRLLRIDRELLKLAKRAAGLREIMRPDPDPGRPLAPGFYAAHSNEAGLRSRDELWQTAVVWAERSLDPQHPKCVNALEHLTALLAELIERGVVTKKLPMKWDDLRARIERELCPGGEKRDRGRNYVVHRLSALTGVAVNTIREAIERAETPRYGTVGDGIQVLVLPLGTTLEWSEQFALTLLREDEDEDETKAKAEADRQQQVRLEIAKRRFVAKSATGQGGPDAADPTVEESREYAQLHSDVRSRLPPDASEDDVLSEVDLERAKRAGRID